MAEKKDVELPDNFAASFNRSNDPFAFDIQSTIGPAFQNQSGLRASLNKPQYLFQDQLARKRTWNERLFYGVGTTYLFGLGTGGLWGLVEGLRNPEASTFRLRFNSMLNSITRRGPFLGNSLGVLALMYHCFDGTIVAVRGSDDIINNISAGTLTGLLFKSTSGIRAAGLAAIIGGSIAAAATFAEEFIQTGNISFQQYT